MALRSASSRQEPVRTGRMGEQNVGNPQLGAGPCAHGAITRHGSTIAIAVCMLVVLLVTTTSPTVRPGVPVYALSFGHYFAYWLAYRHGAIDPAIFRRDSVLLKTLSLAVFGWAFFSAGADALALVVMATGFGLNMLAANALGAERTYYGVELGSLPRMRISRFPFNVIPHPMLTGNMMAYAGALLDAEFRSAWWPLACVHVALNAGLLLMELKVKPLGGQPLASAGPRRFVDPLGISPASQSVAVSLATVSAGLALGAMAGALAQSAFNPHRPLLDATVVGACLGILAVVMYRAYTTQTGSTFSMQSSEA